MRSHISLTGIVSTMVLVVTGLAETARAELKVGDPAPDFTLRGSDGKDYSLAQFAGKQAVVVAWFPKAFTGGCTAECKSMKETGDEIRKFKAAYFTASIDDAEKNAAFAKSLDLDFPILSDPTKKIAEAYGVVHAGRPVAERWTFYIGTDGKVKAIEKQVNTKEAGKQMAQELETLGVPKK